MNNCMAQDTQKTPIYEILRSWQCPKCGKPLKIERGGRVFTSGCQHVAENAPACISSEPIKNIILKIMSDDIPRTIPLISQDKKLNGFHEESIGREVRKLYGIGVFDMCLSPIESITIQKNSLGGNGYKYIRKRTMNVYVMAKRRRD